MVAAQSVSAEVAWTLFYGEWGRIPSVDADNFGRIRGEFWERIRPQVQMPSMRDTTSLLQFEFFARAGEAGLAQFERYQAWSQQLVFDEKSCAGMPPAVRDEYCKTLWLEMRLIESFVGLVGLNQDFGKFVKSSEDGRSPSYDNADNRAIYCSIDIFSPTLGKQKGGSIDSAIKAETGHWMFARFADSKIDSWTMELMDRMNCAGLTPRAMLPFVGPSSAKDFSPLSPETLTFVLGGYYLAGGVRLKKAEADVQVYPRHAPANKNYLQQQFGRFEFMHENAESVERMIRDCILLAESQGRIETREAYPIYRRVGLYVSLLVLEGKNTEKIISKLQNFDIHEINNYFENYQSRRNIAMQHALLTGDWRTFKRTLELIDEFREEQFTETLWEIIKSPRNYWFACRAARTMLKIKEAPSNEEGDFLRTLAFFPHHKEEIVAMGQKALPALEKIVDTFDPRHATANVSEILGKIGGKEAVRILRKVNTDGEDVAGQICKAYYLAKNGDNSELQILWNMHSSTANEIAEQFDQARARKYLLDLGLLSHEEHGWLIAGYCFSD
ncbi:MAG: hypothetical protein WC901_07390 [Candidatus Margulisiibacteriota bacterium]